MNNDQEKDARLPTNSNSAKRPLPPEWGPLEGEKLRESERSFRELADNIPQLCWLAEPSGWLFWYNKGWYDYSGTTFEEMQGWGWTKIHHPDHVDRVVESFATHMRSGEPWDITFPLRSKTGEWRWFLSRARPTRNDSGEIVRWIGTNTDITEQRENEERLRELDRAKTLFLTNVSHEFRTPLTLMLGPIEEALSLETKSLSGESLELVQRNALRLQKLVNSLLDFSRIEAGRMKMSVHPTDLSQFTKDVASVFRSAVEKAGLRFIVECAPLSEPAYIDREMWEKLVLNLLSNAFKFTCEGEIRLELHETAKEFCLRIKDTGIGIAKEQLPQLFQRFHRVEGAKSRSHEGSGIGLALVQELAKMHGGRIDVESDLGVGTVFTVHISKGKDHFPKDSIEETSSKLAASRLSHLYADEIALWGNALINQSVSDSPTSLSESLTLHQQFEGKARVLLADDNTDMREYAERLLRSRWNVECAVDGMDLWERALKNPPDIIVTDIMMPRMDGYRLLKKLREDIRTRTIPVIFLSAKAGEEAITDGLTAGADAYIAKPFAAKELLVRVETALNIAKIRHEANAEIKRTKDFLQAILDNSTAIVFAKDKDGRFVLSNKVMEKDFGDLVGKTDQDVFPDNPEIVEELRKVDREVLTSGKIRVTEEKVFIAGEERTYYSAKFPLVWDGGETVICGIAFDITELKKVQKELSRSNAELARSNAALAQFSQVASHDLKEPLRTIKMFLHLIKNRLGKEIDAQTSEYMQFVTNASKRMESLVDDLLAFSEVETQPREFEEIPSDSALNDALLNLEAKLEETGAKLSVGNLPTIRADRSEAARLFQNLVGNALKYRKPNIKPSIGISAERKSNEWVFSISDNGIGFESQFAECIFEPFRRLHGREVSGTGIGLATCARIVQRHGGKIWAESKPQCGSTFFFTFPVVEQSEPKLKGANVLVVDDSRENQVFADIILRENGAAVRIAQSGDEAVKTIANGERFDVVLMDIQMPGMSGIEATQKLRELGYRKPIVAYTGHTRNSNKEYFATVGFDDYVDKNLPPDPFITLVEQYFKKKPSPDKRSDTA